MSRIEPVEISVQTEHIIAEVKTLSDQQNTTIQNAAFIGITDSEEAGFDKYWENLNPFEYEDHDFINPSAPELLLILRRNPKLTAWLVDP